MDMIVLENVVKMYENGRRAVSDCSMTIRQGENVLIIGAAGSGKTTLMKLIAGCEPPSAGSIIVDGQEVYAMSGERAAKFRNNTFGIMPRSGFICALTMIENIALPLALRKTPVKERERAAMEQMNHHGIGHLVNAYPAQLSSFELQLGSLSRALIARPKILLMDCIDANLTEKEKARFPFLTMLGFSELTLVRFSDKHNDDWPYDRRLYMQYGKLTEA